MSVPERILEAEERRALYILAERYLLRGGQSYSIGNRALTRADLKEIRRAIKDLDTELVTLRRGNQIVQHRVVPRDV